MNRPCARPQRGPDPGGKRSRIGEDALPGHGLGTPSVHAAARAFVAGLPEPERILLCEAFGREAQGGCPGIGSRHAIAACHYRAGRLGLVHRGEVLPADYARTTLGQWMSQTLGIAIEAGNMDAILQVFRTLGAAALAPEDTSPAGRRTTTLDLWPPLSLIRGTLAGAVEAPAGATLPTHAGAEAAPSHASDAAVPLPLTELARRREAVAARAFPARWAPGRLVSVLHEGRLLGVLLDQCLRDKLWRGWMAASEADWASAYDLLLEPGDEPFEPLFGLIQTWNVLTLEQRPQLCARVLGELSATRLHAVRAVHDEWAVQQPLGIAPEPGRIALRTAGGTFSVLSGTPLGVDDPRIEYQGLYLEAATRLQAASAQPGHPALAAPVAEGWWSRLVGWFQADGVVRPALALLALVVVLQSGFLLRPVGEDEEVRSTPAAASEVLLLRWKAGTPMAEAQALLRAAGAEAVGGPDAQGRWRLRLAGDTGQGRALLAGSPLVESVEAP